MTLKCANCESPAEFSLTDPGVSPIDYCTDCLPYHMRADAGYGKMPLRVITDAVEQPEGNVQNVPIVDEPAKKRK